MQEHKFKALSGMICIFFSLFVIFSVIMSFVWVSYSTNNYIKYHTHHSNTCYPLNSSISYNGNLGYFYSGHIYANVNSNFTNPACQSYDIIVINSDIAEDRFCAYCQEHI